MYYLNVKKGTILGPHKLSPTQQRKKRCCYRKKQQILDKLRQSASRLHFEVINSRPFSHQYTVAVETFRRRHEKLLHRLYKLTGIREDPYHWIQGWIDAREVLLVARELKLMNNYRQSAEEKKAEPLFEDHPRWVEDWDKQAAIQERAEQGMSK